MALHPPLELDPAGDVFLQDNLRPSIAEHALHCSHLFQKYMALPGIMPDPTIMDDQLARFTLWTANVDVFGPLNISLDYRLRYSPTVVEIIHQLLDVICDSLTSLKPIEDPPQSPSRKKQRISEMGDTRVTKRAEDDSSDTDHNEDRAEENVSLVSYNIGGTVTRLFRLSNAIRRSAKSKRTSRIGRYTDDEEANTAIEELRHYTDCYIRFRFPEAPEFLRSAMVEANALRLRRLFYQRSHRKRINLSSQHPQANPKTLQLPEMAKNVPNVRFAPSGQPKHDNHAGEKPKTDVHPPAPITYATTAQQTAVKALYANSVPDLPRAKSVLVNNKLSFPPVPTTDECPYCGVVLEFKGAAASTMWNDHVIRDLEPFVCVFIRCSESHHEKSGPSTFETSKDWMNHMQNAHGYAWECRAPSHDPIVYENEADYQEHACSEHGVPKAHVHTLSNAARRPVFEKVLDCPFGDDFQPSGKNDSTTIFSNEALHLHIAAHMKEIALLSLQKLPSDDDDNAENVDSDQPLDDNGPGFANLRGSMYSVLDDEALDFHEEGDDVDGINPKVRPEEVGSAIERLDLEERDAMGRSRLHNAIRLDDLSAVGSLLDQGASLNSRDNTGRTPLHYASLAQNSDILRLLLNTANDCFIDLGDEHGQTALHYAAENDTDSFKIRLMVDHGGDLNITDNYGFSPYMWAIIVGRPTAVQLILDFGFAANTTIENGRSALGWAASLGHSSVVGLLIDKGADINTVTQPAQVAPLDAAAACGALLTAKLLLDRGANPNIRDRDGWSALHWAAEQGHIGVVELLLNMGAMINAVSSYGTSALHCAANGGHIEVVYRLLELGANPAKSTCHGWTPLHHAAFLGHSQVVMVLLANDSTTSTASQQDNHGWSALHLAVLSRDLDTIKVLLQYEAISKSLDLCDESGLTAEEWLDLGPMKYSSQKTSRLAFAKSRCCRATTGLRLAVVNGNIPMVKMLLAQGHPINGTDSGNRTALYYAVKGGHVSIMNLLLAEGADPNIVPKGCIAWETFVVDDTILSRLKKAGYKWKSISHEVESKIRAALQVQGKSFHPGQSMSPRSMATTSEEGKSVTKPDKPRSRMITIWDRLRGQ